MRGFWAALDSASVPGTIADAIIVFADPLDVVRRADGQPKQRSKIVCSHNHILLEATWVTDTGASRRRPCQANIRPRRRRDNLPKYRFKRPYKLFALGEGGGICGACMTLRLGDTRASKVGPR